jgi:hypothetical protein
MKNIGLKAVSFYQLRWHLPKLIECSVKRISQNNHEPVAACRSKCFSLDSLWSSNQWMLLETK